MHLRVELIAQYTFAIRQAPHPLRSVCSVMAQTRLRLACSLCFLSALTGRTILRDIRPLNLHFRVYGRQEHKNDSTKISLLGQYL